MSMSKSLSLVKNAGLIFLALLLGVISFAGEVNAQATNQVLTEQTIKDADNDGLSDESEVDKFKTNPYLFDTDGDTFSDGHEVLYKSDPTNKGSTPNPDAPKSVSLLDVGRRVTVPWLVARGSGIGAFVLLSLGVCFGIGISSRSAYKFLRPPDALEIHRFLQWISLSFLALHIGSLLFDDHVKLNPFETFIPFIVRDRGFQTALGYDLNIAIAIGIIALYLVIMLIVTSEIRAKISIRLWRRLHYFSFPTYVLFLVHGFFTGTDSKEWWATLIYQISIISVLLSLILRLKGIYQLAKLKQKAELKKQVPVTHQETNKNLVETAGTTQAAQ